MESGIPDYHQVGSRYVRIHGSLPSIHLHYGRDNNDHHKQQQLPIEAQSPTPLSTLHPPLISLAPSHVPFDVTSSKINHNIKSFLATVSGNMVNMPFLRNTPISGSNAIPDQQQSMCKLPVQCCFSNNVQSQ